MNTGRKYYFITIAEFLNITRAARRLMVSQPSLTQYLNKLESDLEIKLVDRSFTPLRLTEAGQVYYEYLKKERAAEAELRSTLRRLRDSKHKRLLIGLPLQKSHLLASRVIPEFAREHPDIEVSLWEGTSQTVREGVLKGELDIGFGHTMGEPFDGLEIQPLNREKILIVCNREEPIAAGRQSSQENTMLVRAEELDDVLFYQMAADYYLYEVESRHMRAHGVHPRRITVMSNLHAVLAAVISDGGFAYMPDYALREFGAERISDRMAYLRLDEKDLEWDFSMFRLSHSPVNLPMRLFWTKVTEACCRG